MWRGLSSQATARSSCSDRRLCSRSLFVVCKKSCNHFQQVMKNLSSRAQTANVYLIDLKTFRLKIWANQRLCFCCFYRIISASMQPHLARRSVLCYQVSKKEFSSLSFFTNVAIRSALCFNMLTTSKKLVSASVSRQKTHFLILFCDLASNRLKFISWKAKKSRSHCLFTFLSLPSPPPFSLQHRALTHTQSAKWRGGRLYFDPVFPALPWHINHHWLNCSAESLSAYFRLSLRSATLKCSCWFTSYKNYIFSPQTLKLKHSFTAESKNNYFWRNNIDYFIFSSILYCNCPDSKLFAPFFPRIQCNLRQFLC